MAHVDKYHIGAIGHLCKHFERAKDENGEYIKFKNQSIDLSKTDGNYNLATFQPLPQQDFIRKRLGEVKVYNRPDVKVMCDWVVTLPKGKEYIERRFFDETFKFLSGRYGRENVISAYVHRDETQPHMHFAFIPVTTDKKKGIQKVSAKEVLTRAELQKFHGDLDGYLAGVFGNSMGVLNDATKEGNKSIEELKRGTAVKKLQGLQDKIKAEEKRIDALKWGDRIKPIKEKKDVVVISREDYESANDAKAKRRSLEGQVKEAEEKAAAAINRNQAKELARIWNDYVKLKTERFDIEAEKYKYKSDIANFIKVSNAYPSFFAEFTRLSAELARIEQAEQYAAQEAKRRLKQLQNQHQAEAE